MSKNRSHIKCPNCGKFNINREYCIKCGALISSETRRALREEQEEHSREVQELKEATENPSFYEKNKNHKYWIVRAFAKVINSIWLAFVAIGTFIAWLFTAIAA